MTTPRITLDGVSHALPDGRTLFSDLHDHFDARPTGLVGRNGAGKSVLGRILAGQQTPTAGRCTRSGRAHLLAQHVPDDDHATVATLAGVQELMDALERIEAGSVAAADFDIVGDRWDIRQRLQHALEQDGLGHLQADTLADTLSGGMAVRVAVAGALASQAEMLILDEPSNHLDRDARRALLHALRQWPGGLIVISHDRQLLEGMERIVELSSLGLHSHGGNYSHYVEAKTREQEAARQLLDARRTERRRGEQALRVQRERQQRREASGHRQARDANQAPILLGRQKERSEGTAGKLQAQHAAAREALGRQVREAARKVEDETIVALRVPDVTADAGRFVATLQDVQLPHVEGAASRITLTVGGRQRIGVIGPNGCGKSTLLRVVAGQLAPLAGQCTTVEALALLDQQLAVLDPTRSVLEVLCEARPGTAEGELRTLLAQAGLDASMVQVPSGRLSGGERVKAALACVLYADTVPRLLLLDEPGNHLDLVSQQALEKMLRAYQGALLVVSHDDAFLQQLALTDHLLATPEGWMLEPQKP